MNTPISGTDLAIIGIGMRLPTIATLDDFWQLLAEGRDVVRDLDTLSNAPIVTVNQDHGHDDYVAKTIWLDDYDRFDAEFFKFSPREAEITDPQLRLLLESAHMALEDAAIDTHRAGSGIAVYAGTAFSAYLLNHLHADKALFETLGSMAILSANDKDYAASLIAYKLGLEGPAVAVNTACSSSLVAVHMACGALLAGECDVALAGAAKLQLPHGVGYRYETGGVHAPDGTCRAFDADAAGTVAGSGAATVVIKRLAEAIADGDPIHAVIKGSAINNDGARKVGFTAPSIQGQAEVIAEAWHVADLPMENAGYLEAHGTGTPLGDPIEIAALNQAFAGLDLPPESIPLGSVKTNLGHLDPAAGLAGLIKVILMLKRGHIPASLHFKKANPAIDFAAGPFYVNDRFRPWPDGKHPRCAGVSSFGVGGTNAHVVLTEAPQVPTQNPSRRWLWAGLSAEKPAALDRYCTDLGTFLGNHTHLSAASVAATLLQGRSAFTHRMAVVGRETETIASALAESDPTSLLVGQLSGAPPEIAFLFPGQGSQFEGMGCELYEEEPVFRQAADRLAERMQPLLDLDLRSLIWPDLFKEKSPANLNDICYTLPAMLLIELATAELWKAQGVQPHFVMGYSFGEYAAATVAGIFSEEAAVDLAVMRGALMQTCPAGAMLSVPLSETACQPFLEPRVALAAVNGADRCILSGEKPALQELAATLAQQAIDAKWLRVAHGYHSHQMDGILDAFATRIQKCRPQPPRIPVVSSLTGQWLTDKEAIDAAYWVRHLREPIRFWQGLQTLKAHADILAVELGPGRVLCDLASSTVQTGTPNRAAIPSLHGRDDITSDGETFAQAGARLWLAGVAVAPTFEPDVKRCHLPTYPFQRRRYWHDPPSTTRHPATRLASADRFFVPTWQQVPCAPSLPTTDEQPGTAWIFLDARGIGAALCQKLREQGWQVATIRAGSTFQCDDALQAMIRIGVEDDTDVLVQQLLQHHATPTLIVHGWQLSGEEAPVLENSLQSGYLQPMACLRALADAAPAATPRWYFLTDGLYSMTADDLVYPEKAVTLGLVRVLPHEFTTFSTAHVDLPTTGDPEAIASICLAWVTDPSPPLTAAYRFGQFWTQTLVAQPRPSIEGLPAALKQGGTYLITGGFGALGSAVARHLAQHAKANLILVGRKAPVYLSEAAADNQVVENSSDQELLETLQHMGASIASRPVDISDRKALADTLHQMEAAIGPIDGIFHAAGIATGGMIYHNDLEQTRASLSPKWNGILALESYFADREIDFLLLFGSRIIYRGAPGQVNYTAANAVLDAYVSTSNNLNARIIHWDIWAEAGMGTDADLPAAFQADHREHLRAGLTHQEGLDALFRLLNVKVPRVLVTARNPNDDDLRETHGEPSPTLEPSDGISRSRPQLSSLFAAPSNPLENQLASIWQDLLGVDPIGVHDNYFELGGNSLLLSRLAVRLQEELHTPIPIKTLMQKLTISQLADHIAGLKALEWFRQSNPNTGTSSTDVELGEI